MKIRWLLRKKWEEEECLSLSQKWKLSPLLVALILNRGINKEDFEDYSFMEITMWTG